MGTATFNLAEAIVEFVSGTEVNWNSFQLPIPANIVVYTTDSKKFKRGDGIHKYTDLPEGPSIAGIAAGGENILNVLTNLLPADEDSIIIIDNEIYKASEIKAGNVANSVTLIGTRDSIQDADMDTIESQFGMSNTNITSSDDGKLAIITDHKMSPGINPETFVVHNPESPIHIVAFDIYSDKACTQKSSVLNYNSVYYAKLEVHHDTADLDDLTITVTETNAFVEATKIDRDLFKLVIGNQPFSGDLTITATATYNADTTTVNKVVSLIPYTPILASVYGGTGDDRFTGVVYDSNNNIIACGWTSSEGNLTNALIVKFDSNLNIITKKHYGGNYQDILWRLAVDSSDNIYAVGHTYSEGTNPSNVAKNLIIKFDNTLNIISRKYFDANNTGDFYGVTIDSSDNIYAVGYTAAEGPNIGYRTGLIVKFDNNLNILAKKYYGGNYTEDFYDAVVDSNGNIYVVGDETSEANNIVYGGIILKFDSNLNILAKKRYGLSTANTDTGLGRIAIDNSGNIIVVGHTRAEGAGGFDALIMKFDSNLNILARKRYGGAGIEYFYGVDVDQNNNIFACGISGSESFGGATYGDALVVKFDTNLNIIKAKRIGGFNDELIEFLTIDDSGNILCAGHTSSEGSGSFDALLLKLPNIIPSGTFSGSVLSNLIFADCFLTLANSNINLTDCTFNAVPSSLVPTDSALTLSDSNLTQEKETINY